MMLLAASAGEPIVVALDDDTEIEITIEELKNGTSSVTISASESVSVERITPASMLAADNKSSLCENA